ncbi:MAG: hypothetical protein HYR55_20295 [Acidobacteria bacterium]|nr:hypothetical protein [Acidobacteriota bacterium]MBI3656366.1 hypothetical protein [Acidobacteriota bacterium]
MKQTARIRWCRLAFGWLPAALVGLVMMPVPAQQINAPPRDEVNMLDVIKAPGKRLAEGKNTKPAGPLRVKTYYVDEIRPVKPIAVTQGDRVRSVDTVYRLTITGEQFPVRALLTVIWIDDTAYLGVHESEDLRSLSVLLFDRAALKHNAAISVGYGEKEKDMLSILPEKLQIGPNR